MNYKDVNALIEEGEGFTIEFKRRVPSPEKIARTIMGFANTRGGVILFGVDDDGSIVGVESEKSEIDLIETAGKDFCDPPITPASIHIVPFDGKDVIVCTIGESSSKPHYYIGETGQLEQNGHTADNTRVYIRVNDNTVMASREVVKILENENPNAPPLKLSIGENEKRLFAYLEEHKKITAKELGKLVNIGDRRASRLLVRLVRAGVIRIHTHEKVDYYTLAYDINS